MTTRPHHALARLVAFLSLALLSAAGGAQAQIVVDAANPASAEQGVTLDVEVLGSGFKRGAAARFLVTGTDDPGSVAVNSTSYVNNGKLVANITVGDAAALDAYDIEVATPDGRTGKGTEKFTVLPKAGGPAACAPAPAEYGTPIGWLNTVDEDGNPLFGSPDSVTGLGVDIDTRIVSMGEEGGRVLVAAVGGYGAQLVVFFLDPDTGVPVAPHQTVDEGAGRHIRFGDFNGDGVPDIAAAAQGRGGVFVTMGSRTGTGPLTFASPAVRLPPPVATVGQGGYSVAVGNLDGDAAGTDDIVAGFMSGGKSVPARLVVYRRTAADDGFDIVQTITPTGYGSSDAMGGNLSAGRLVGADDCLDIVAGASQKSDGKLTTAGEVAVFGQLKDGMGACAGGFDATPTAILRAAVPRKNDGFGFRTTTDDVDGDGDDDLIVLTGWNSPDIRGDVVAGPIAAGAESISPVRTVRPDAGFGDGWGTTGAELVDWDGDGLADDLFVGAPNASLSSTCGSPGAAYGYLNLTVPGAERVLFQPPTLDEDFAGFGWAVAVTPGSPIVLVTEHGRNVGNDVGAGQVWVYRRP